MKQIRTLYQKAVALCFLYSFYAAAQVNVLTYHNDNGRTGQNLNETTLTPANVNKSTFGKLFTYTVDGYVYAQPLYVSGLNIPGQGTHNVVFVATEHNSVYAFDADSNTGANGGLLWQVNLGPSATTPSSALPFQAIKPEVGITGTPVIDLGSGTLYVDAFTQQGTTFSHYVHALDITTGAERPGSPALVAASVPGKGAGSVNGVMTFNAVQQLQRGALTLAGGVLYVCYAGYTDTPNEDPYHGWVIGFNPSTLTVLPHYVFCTTPNGTVAQYGSIAGRGGIWMGGGGPAVDGNNNLYFATGDGNFNAFSNNKSASDYGDSYMKLSTAGGLSVADYFTPSTQGYQQTNDLDSGSGGVLLLPDQAGPYPHLVIGAGKTQRAFVMNRDMMTSDNKHIDTSGQGDQVIQTMPLGGGSFGTPAYFNGSVYYVAIKDTIRSYALSNGTLVPDLPNSAGTRKYAFPGATLSVSANGNANGIVWAIQNAQPAVLVAYDATDLSTELYNSSQAGSRDQLTGGVKFAVPTVANGKVYVGSQQALSVFGQISGGGGGGGNTIEAGSYSGLFYESSGIEFGKSGMVTIKTSKRGKYSGRLQLGGKSYSFHGSFDPSGASSASVSSKDSGVINISLQLNTSDFSSISGAVSSDSWVANLTANRDVFDKRSNPAPAATYSLTFSGPNDGNPANPQNDGSGTVTVNPAGQLRFRGVLGDGSKISQSTDVAADGSWPFYVPLYKQGGQIMGWINLNGSSASGQANWIKLPNDHSKTFKDGFNLNVPVSGSSQ